MEEYVYIDGKKYRRGYTTGSCATAASKAAVYMLLSKDKIENVNIDTPKGIFLTIKVENIEIGDNYVVCSVKKDGGDDIDATNGMDVYACAQWENTDTPYENEYIKNRVVSFTRDKFEVCAGAGIGVITKKGLSEDPGKPAINPVPQKMIEKEVSSVVDSSNINFENESTSKVKITVYVPEGIEIAKKTFNPRLGIEGGISIIGTTGIVEPMSDEGFKKSLSVEMNMKRALGMDKIILVPGNHGETFIKDRIGDTSSVVRMSNFVGYMLMEAKRLGFKKIILAGHIGKFIKLAAGIFDTHSKVADARSEILISNMALEGADLEILKRLDACLTAEEASNVIEDSGYGYVHDIIAEKCKKRAMDRTDGEIDIEVFIFRMDKTVLGKSSNAEKMLEEFKSSKGL